MKGYDVFYEKPGELEERVCQVCGTRCEVERNQAGPTGWASAMAKQKIPHDYFSCPHTGQDWHEQALKLVMMIEETPSQRLAELVRLDLIDMLNDNGIETPAELS